MVVVKNAFGAWDYVVFAAMLVVSIGIGVFFAFRGGKQKTQGEYLLGNRNMSIIPVAISILVSFMSAILILGTPAEMYTQGTEYSISIFGIGLGIVFAATIFVPLLYPLKITSTFEYLELRFKSRFARLTGTFLMVLSQIVYMGIASFAPSTALEAVTGFPVWATILIIGAVATIYTSIGGMKAVVWTDVFQSLVMVAGLLAIVIQGTIKVGGLARVWELNYDWDRIHFFTFDPDPTVRHSVWSLIIAVSLGWMGTYGVNQASVQRYCSLPTLRKAKMSVFLNVLGVVFLMVVTCLTGIVIFAYFADQDCDPLGEGLINNSNQLVPYFVMETLGYPGVPGLFISSLFSGALSSVSSSLNALAAITWEDILKPRLDDRLSEAKKTALTKILVVIYGAFAIGIGLLAQLLEGTVLQASLSLTGSVGGPMTGMFLLGGLFPWANGIGTSIGALCGLAISLWLSIGAYTAGIPMPVTPYPNGTCPAYFDNNVTADITTTTTMLTTNFMTTQQPEDDSAIRDFYSMSYLWFSGVGILSTVVIGLILSFITGANSMHDVPTKYQIPIFQRWFCCLPKSWLHILGCKRDFKDPNEITYEDRDKEIIIEPPEGTDGMSDNKTHGLDNFGFNGKIGDPYTVNNIASNGQTSNQGHGHYSNPVYDLPIVGDNNNMIIEKF